ncbi:MAG: anti-sigma factor antagonist [Candidatus Zixiibacteriota bacterium]
MIVKSFKYASVIESEGRMYEDIKSFLMRNGIAGKLRGNIMLTVSEGFTNALTHGNNYDSSKSIEITVGINDAIVTADITDEGDGDISSINKRKPPDLMQEGGRGVNLMETIADSFKITKDGSTGGLRISMTFERSRYINAENNKRNLEAIMEFSKKDEGNLTVISLSGRLDLSTGGKLKEEVKKILESGKTTVHLNLSEVEFVNSSGLGALVSIMKEVRIFRGRLTLSNLEDYVQEIFDITQLSHIFEIFTTEEEAIKSYQPIEAS